jgi:uncharacterized protein (DUF983 family)
MYVDQNLLHLSKIIKMHEKCSHCGFKYQIEPSFFYGAMYVGYGLNVAVGIGTFLISYFFSSSLIVAFIAIIAAILLLFPIVMRLSRSIYINMFVDYDKGFKA